MRLLAAGTAKAYASAGTTREQGKKKAVQQPDIAFHSSAESQGRSARTQTFRKTQSWASSL